MLIEIESLEISSLIYIILVVNTKDNTIQIRCQIDRLVIFVIILCSKRMSQLNRPIITKLDVWSFVSQSKTGSTDFVLPHLNLDESVEIPWNIPSVYVTMKRSSFTG